MTIGSSIFLIVVGAILAFALEIDVPGFDASVVGYILMAAGVFGLILGVVLMARRSRPRRTSATEVTEAQGAEDGDAVVHRTDRTIE